MSEQGRDVAGRLSELYTGRALRRYVRWKVRTDPAYGAIFDRLGDRREPLVDVGCGIGLLAFYLRERGFTAPIVGIDFDERKIEQGRRAAAHYRDVELIAGDARCELPSGHDVAMLDILQYFDGDSQQRILSNAARALRTGGIVAIRQGVRDRSWRHRMTAVVDAFGRASRWMKAERLQFPTREEIAAPFAEFESEIVPLWGRMPYNNYLFVFRNRGDQQSSCASSGMTNE